MGTRSVPWAVAFVLLGGMLEAFAQSSPVSTAQAGAPRATASGIASRSNRSPLGAAGSVEKSPEVLQGPVFRDPRTGRYMQQLIRTENVEVQRFDWRPRTSNSSQSNVALSGSALGSQASLDSQAPQYQLAPRLVRTWNPFSPTKIVWDKVPLNRPPILGTPDSAAIAATIRSVQRQQYVVLQPVDRSTAEAYEASRRQAVGTRTASLPASIPEASSGWALPNRWQGASPITRPAPSAELQPSYSAGIRAMEERGMPAQVLR